jgi:hypothetical protein
MDGEIMRQGGMKSEKDITISATNLLTSLFYPAPPFS